jgi:hypothetical protein
MEHRTNSLLFGFQFSGLVTRGVFFGGPMTLLIGIDTWNAGWQVDVSDGRMSESIPSEAYDAIGLVMVNAGGFRTNAPYFAELEQALRAIVQRGSADMADESSILGLLSMCKTSDSRYDSDGLRPFFNHWRRVHPSPMNLRKIERTFGAVVRNQCYERQTTAIWSDVATPRSLDFLDPRQAMASMSQAT